MLKRITLLTLVLAMLSTTQIFAQDDAPADDESWSTGVGIGMDFVQLLQINPRVGAGQNKIGFGGSATFFANYKKDRAAWNNNAALRFGIAKFGAGVVAGTNEEVPWLKEVDELRFDSKYGYSIKEDGKLYYAALFSFLSQITPTYDGNFLSSFNNGDVISKLFSPATINFSLGLDYKPTENLSIYFSPLAYKAIIVADDEIASLEAFDENGIGLGKSRHGNPWTSATDFDNVFNQLGATLRADYTRKFMKDDEGNARLLFRTDLTLYSNYLQQPENIDVNWNTETSFRIFKGLQLALSTNLFYDHDVFVQVTDYDAPGGVNGLGRKVSFTQQLLIKYAINF